MASLKDRLAKSLQQCIFRELRDITKFDSPFELLFEEIKCVKVLTFSLDKLMYVLFGQKLNTKLGLSGEFLFSISEPEKLLVVKPKFEDGGVNFGIVLSEINSKDFHLNFDPLEDLSQEIMKVKIDILSEFKIELFQEKDVFKFMRKMVKNYPSLVIQASNFRSEGQINFNKAFSDRRIQFYILNDQYLELRSKIKYNFLFNFRSFISKLFWKDEDENSGSRTARASVGGIKTMILDVVWDFDLKINQACFDLEVNCRSRKSQEGLHHLIKWSFIDLRIQRITKQHNLRYYAEYQTTAKSCEVLMKKEGYIKDTLSAKLLKQSNKQFVLANFSNIDINQIHSMPKIQVKIQKVKLREEGLIKMATKFNRGQDQSFLKSILWFELAHIRDSLGQEVDLEIQELDFESESRFMSNFIFKKLNNKDCPSNQFKVREMAQKIPMKIIDSKFERVSYDDQTEQIVERIAGFGQDVEIKFEQNFKNSSVTQLEGENNTQNLFSGGVMVIIEEEEEDEEDDFEDWRDEPPDENNQKLKKQNSDHLEFFIGIKIKQYYMNVYKSIAEQRYDFCPQLLGDCLSEFADMKGVKVKIENLCLSIFTENQMERKFNFYLENKDYEYMKAPTQLGDGNSNLETSTIPLDAQGLDDESDNTVSDNDISEDEGQDPFKSPIKNRLRKNFCDNFSQEMKKHFLNYLEFRTQVKNQNKLYLRLYFLKDLEITMETQSIKKMLVLCKENIVPKDSFYAVLELLDSCKSSLSDKDFIFTSYFGHHSKYNMSLLAYPSSVLQFNENHCHYIRNKETIRVQDMIIKKAKSFKQINKVFNQFTNHQKNQELLFNNVFFDLHSSDVIRKGKEFQRCLVHISKAKFEHQVTNKSKNHVKNFGNDYSDEQIEVFIKESIGIGIYNQFQEQIFSKIKKKDFFKLLQKMNATQKNEIKEASIYMLKLDYEHLESHFDLLRVNLVDKDLRSDLSLRKELGFTEIMNIDKFKHFQFSQLHKLLWNSVPLDNIESENFDEPIEESGFKLVLIGNISISGTLKAIRILRNNVIDALFNKDYDKQTSQRSDYQPKIAPLNQVPTKNDDDDFECLFDTVFSPNEYLFHCDFESLYQMKYKSFYILSKLEYNILNGKDFQLVKDDPSIRKLIEHHKIRKNLGPRLQKSNQKVVKGVPLNPNSNIFKEDMEEEEIDNLHELPIQPTHSQEAEMSMSKDFLNQAFNFNNSFRAKSTIGVMGRTKSRKFMRNIREKNSIILEVNQIALQSYESNDPLKPGIDKIRSKLVFSDVNVKDNVEKSKFRYILRTRKRKNNDNDRSNYALEISHEHDLNKPENPNGEKEYEIELYIPDLDIYLTSESKNFLSDDKTKEWFGVLQNFIMSLIGKIPPFKISTMTANGTDIKMYYQTKSNIKKPIQKHSLNLQAQEYKNMNVKNIEGLIRKVIFTRFIDGNPKWMLNQVIEQIPIASDVSNILKGVLGNLDKAKQQKSFNLEIAGDILKEVSNGTMSLAECSIISVVRWANLGGAKIDEETLTLNMRQLFSKMSPSFRNEMTKSIFKDNDTTTNDKEYN